MATLLILISVFASILLVLVVLIQPGKSEMISGMGGLGGQINSMLGVRTGRNFLQNLTIGLMAAIMVIAIVANKLFLDHGDVQKGPVTQGRSIPASSIPNAPSVPAPQPPAGK